MRPSRPSPARARALLFLCLSAAGGSASAQTVTPFASVAASASAQNHPAAHAIDADLGTRWQASGAGQSITGTLAQVGTVSAVRVAWYRGASRRYTFRVEAAGTDGVFRVVFSGSSSGTTAQRERYAVTPTVARQLRVVVNGNTANTQAAIREMDAEVSAAPAPGPGNVTVSVSPSAATLAPGAQQKYAATVSGATDTSVAWSVAEGAAGGSVDAGGTYTAPATAGTYHVVATSNADRAKTASAAATVQGTTSPPAPTAGGRCAAEPLRTTGTTHYFCDCQAGADPGCVAGNDGNAGTSPGAPKRTWGAAMTRFTSLPAGDTVALCKGGRFDGTQFQTRGWTSPSCTTASPCVLRDYTPGWASGDEARPQVDYTGSEVGLVIGGSTVAQTDGIRVLNLAFVSGARGSVRDTYGVWLRNYVSDFEMCNSVVDGFYLGIYSEIPAGSCSTVKNAGGSARRRFLGNRILNNSLDGALVDDNDSVYDGNYWDNNGHDTADGFTHILNAGGGASHTYYAASECFASGNRFVNNEIRRNAFYQGAVNNTAVWHSPSNVDAVVENNLIDQTPTSSRWLEGIAMGAWQSNYWFNRPVIRGNRILMNRGRAIDVSEASQAVVEGNVIELRGGSWSEDVIAIPRTNVSPSYATSSNSVIRDNTVLLENMSGGPTILRAGTPAGSGYTVSGNSFTVVNSPGVTCFQFGSNGDVVSMDANQCSGAATWVRADGTYTLESWRAATPWDDASTTAAPAAAGQ